MSAIVIDIGGTTIRCAVADENASLLQVRKTTLPDFAQRQGSRIWADIINTIVDYERFAREALSPEAPVVVSFPGPVARPSRILSAPTLVGADTTVPDLRSELAARTGRSVCIMNDLSAAAWHVSRTITDDRFLVVTVSSGIGSKLFDRAHPHGVFDELPFAGEIGHVTIDVSPEAMPCDCGGKGHLGAVASGRGVERRARRAASQEPDRFAQSICATTFRGRAEVLTNEDHIVPAASMGDPWAIEIIRESTKPLAGVLLSVTAAAGLERIVIIGGFALSLGRIYVDVLREELLNLCDFEILRSGLTDLLVLGGADEEACLQGAAAYAVHRTKKDKR